MKRCAKHRTIQHLYDEQQSVEAMVSRAVWLKTTHDAMELHHHATLRWWRLKLSYQISEAEQPDCCQVAADARATFAQICEGLRGPLLAREHSIDPQKRLDLLSVAALERIAARPMQRGLSQAELEQRVTQAASLFSDSLRLLSLMELTAEHYAEHSNLLVVRYHLALRDIVGARSPRRVAA